MDAAVLAGPEDTLLDMGCGVGGAMLCVACRVPGIAGLGIDIQEGLVALCRRNIERNSFAAGLSVRRGDATSLPPDLYGTFDHVLMNPPYHEESRHDVSPDKLKRAANTEKTGDLSGWIGSASLALKSSGTVTLIHRADRRDEILTLLQPAFGGVEALPLLPKKGAEPKRVILRARKGQTFSVKEVTPLVLHKDSGAYTEEAELVLRHCGALLAN
jgi:tRNA1(Val) A37 N6-methylase TrmN6